MRAIHNARILLLATLLSTMASASFAAGTAAPIGAGIFYGQGIPVHAIVIGAMVCAVPLVGLHGLAQLVLGGIR
jgi:hypothetical protein